MQPVKHSICHSVKEKATSHQSCKPYSPVGVSHIAAPVHEDKRGEHHDNEQLAGIVEHGHSPAELLGEAVLFLVKAEEYCQKNERIDELNQLDGLYHMLVFI
jgi:hypothetical protein